MLRWLAVAMLMMSLVAPPPVIPGRVAFVRGGNLWLLEGGQERQLTQNGGVRVPVLSPSGRYVTYWLEQQQWVAGTDGSGPWRLTLPGVEFAVGTEWAPADDTLAFGTGQGLFTVTMTPAGPAQPVLVAAGWLVAPVWSPDGQSLAAARIRVGEGATVVVVPRSGGAERTVVQEAPDQVAPCGPVGNGIPAAWSADGQWLTLVRGGITASLAADCNELAVVPAAGGEPEGVGAGPISFAWSPQGATLAFTDGPGRMYWENKTVRLAPMPPQPPYQGLTPPGYADREPAWSADGRFVAFTRSRAEAPADMNQPQPEQAIVIASPELGRTWTAPGSEGGVAPRWGPGHSLLWVRPDQRTAWYLPSPDSRPVRAVQGLDLTDSYYGQWAVGQVLDWWVPQGP